MTVYCVLPLPLLRPSQEPSLRAYITCKVFCKIGFVFLFGTLDVCLILNCKLQRGKVCLAWPPLSLVYTMSFGTWLLNEATWKQVSKYAKLNLSCIFPAEVRVGIMFAFGLLMRRT